MPRSPRRKTIYATGAKHNVDINDLPIAVAKGVSKVKHSAMRERHERERQKLMADLLQMERRMNSEAFTDDIFRRLSNIREQVKNISKKRKKSVRFSANVKRDSRHRVMY
tara:strand:- start:2028 stop:2357 length:330 start_codon:yes stop_codon:yes gene_type:complete